MKTRDLSADDFYHFVGVSSTDVWTYAWVDNWTYKIVW